MTMAKSKSRTPASNAQDRKPTVAERDLAIRFLQRQGGAHIPRPPNGLIQDTPASTIDRCRQVVSWLAHIEQPFSGGELDAAQSDVLLMVADALGHAEKVVRSVGAQADVQVANG
jgi:hypothetical protein